MLCGTALPSYSERPADRHQTRRGVRADGPASMTVSCGCRRSGSSISVQGPVLHARLSDGDERRQLPTEDPPPQGDRRHPGLRDAHFSGQRRGGHRAGAGESFDHPISETFRVQSQSVLGAPRACCGEERGRSSHQRHATTTLLHGEPSASYKRPAGRSPGRMVWTMNGPSPESPRASLGSTPAATSDDLPEPDGPIT